MNPYYRASDCVGRAGQALSDLRTAMHDVDDPHDVAQLLRELFLTQGPIPRVAEIVRDIALWAHKEGLTEDALHTSLLDDSTALSRLAWRLADAGDQVDHQTEQITCGQARTQAALIRSPVSVLAGGAAVLQGDGVTVTAEPAGARSR
ncbi:hypothetical protein [Kitasatospora sp. GAS1066B]|uniref:hypothetical protein n=1 Tax=Kitasatospora sp. GAS1066B TaxID=3156271 RepID=UPI00351942AC